MSVTRRKGIIATLVAVAAAITRGQTSAEGRRWLSIDLSPVSSNFSEIDWDATKAESERLKDQDIVTMKPRPAPEPQGLEVKLGGLLVRLTAEEIMDALEAK